MAACSSTTENGSYKMSINPESYLFAILKFQHINLFGQSLVRMASADGSDFQRYEKGSNIPYDP